MAPASPPSRSPRAASGRTRRARSRKRPSGTGWSSGTTRPPRSPTSPSSYCKKGDKVYVEGSIEYRSWQDREGQTRYTTEINARELILLSGQGDGAESVHRRRRSARPGRPPPRQGVVRGLPRGARRRGRRPAVLIPGLPRVVVQGAASVRHPDCRSLPALGIMRSCALLAGTPRPDRLPPARAGPSRRGRTTGHSDACPRDPPSPSDQRRARPLHGRRAERPRRLGGRVRHR